MISSSRYCEPLVRDRSTIRSTTRRLTHAFKKGNLAKDKKKTHLINYNTDAGAGLMSGECKQCVLVSKCLRLLSNAMLIITSA